MKTSAAQVAEVFGAFLRLGLTSFGGPVAHLGYFRRALVGRRRWIDDAGFGDLIALCQFLPGPASSQLGIALGAHRAGWAGGLAAWLGFTLPSALAMIAFGYVLAHGGSGHWTHAHWLHGLQLTAVAIVAQAVVGMAWRFSRGLVVAAISVAAAEACALAPSAFAAPVAIALGAAIGAVLLDREVPAAVEVPRVAPQNRALAIGALIAFAALLIVLPLASAASGAHALELFDRFYRAGALVFGGGHVLLPLLQSQVVPPGWTSDDLFLAGYGAAQALPGPLFAFAAYLGVVMTPAPNGWLGGLLCLFAAFLPSFLLLTAALPFWRGLRRRAGMAAALAGCNAAVVGVLAAALYAPIFTGSVHTHADLGIAVLGLVLLLAARLPSWAVLVSCTALTVAIGA